MRALLLSRRPLENAEMGIPYLMHHLQPYAAKVFLTRSDDGDEQQLKEPRQAVIDGPALAYHIYYICSGKRGGARNAFESIPSYHELGATTLTWLDEIQQYNITMYVLRKDPCAWRTPCLSVEWRCLQQTARGHLFPFNWLVWRVYRRGPEPSCPARK